jgi:uncharacterized protein (DUF983 family)
MNPLNKERLAMAKISTTPAHCPGFQELRNLKSFICRCPECGKEKEIFSDEFNRSHTCAGCGKPIDFTRCGLDSTADSKSPR